MRESRTRGTGRTGRTKKAPRTIADCRSALTAFGGYRAAEATTIGIGRRICGFCDLRIVFAAIGGADVGEGAGVVAEPVVGLGVGQRRRFV